MFIVTITGNFKQKMTARIDAWKAQKTGAMVYAPDELKWWLWQEYGTAGPYPIEPVNAKYLAFPGADGRTIFSEHVDHPGIPPRHSVEKALPEIHEAAITTVQEAFEEGAADEPGILQEAVLRAVQNAKELIVQSIAENLPGTREDGRLLGESASSVFDALATVIKTE